MKFLNNRELNIILDIVLDLIVECYILWNMKILLMIKLGLAIKKILNIYGFNLLDYLSNENALLMEYAERKILALRKDNAMMKQYLDKKDELKLLRPNLTIELSNEFEDRNKYEGEIAKIAGSIDQTEQEKDDATLLNISLFILYRPFFPVLFEISLLLSSKSLIRFILNFQI